jgi:aryl carrier-like protein
VSLRVFLDEVAPIENYADMHDMVTQLRNDDVERVVIGELADELSRDGKFRDPLRVEDGVLTNGSHRLAALVVADASCVDVFVVRDGVFEDRWRDPVVTRATFRVAAADENLFDDEDDLISTALWAARSMAVLDGWLESDGASGRQRDGFVEVDYDYYATRPVVEAAIELILARFARFGMRGELLSIGDLDY